MLFPPLLERIEELIDGGYVSGYEHRWARDNSGRLWVRKKEQDVGVEPIAAEIIGWYLARALSVPVPHAAIYTNPENTHATSFLSRTVSSALHWDPQRRDFVTNIEDLGNILALDVLLMNSDRHAANLLLQPTPNELYMKLWAIDTGNALVSCPSDFLDHADEIPQIPRAPDIPFRDIKERAMDVAERTTMLLPAHVDGPVREAFEVTGIQGADEVIEVLCQRCRRAPELVSRYLSRCTHER